MKGVANIAHGFLQRLSNYSSSFSIFKKFKIVALFTHCFMQIIVKAFT